MHNTRQTIDELWHRLGLIHTLRFNAEAGARSRMHWHGRGHGHVTTRFCGDTCRFEESGKFLPQAGRKSLSFHNVYQWHYQDDSRCITLSHARYDPTLPVRLFDISEQDGALACTHPHQCGEDAYHARIVVSAHGFSMHWQINGPRKDEHLHYIYTA